MCVVRIESDGVRLIGSLRAILPRFFRFFLAFSLVFFPFPAGGLAEGLRVGLMCGLSVGLGVSFGKCLGAGLAGGPLAKLSGVGSAKERSTTAKR